MAHKLTLYGTAFTIGAAAYSLIEILWRGYTHWTMTITGGFCMVMLMFISTLSLARPLKWLLGAVSITAVEFAVGCIVNLRLGWAVWDYSDLPLNLFGQVSLLFTLVWFLLSIPAVFICEKLSSLPTFRHTQRYR